MHTTETKQENNNRKTLRFRYERCLEASNLLQLPWSEIVDDGLLAVKLLNKKHYRAAVVIREQAYRELIYSLLAQEK